MNSALFVYGHGNGLKDANLQICDAAGKLPLERAVGITMSICRAVDYIHAHGVVHRDLKPGQHHDRRWRSHQTHRDFVGIARVRVPGTLTFGSLADHGHAQDYISLEQVGIAGRRAQRHLCAGESAFYELFTGKTLFRGFNPFAAMNDR